MRNVPLDSESVQLLLVIVNDAGCPDSIRTPDILIVFSGGRAGDKPKVILARNVRIAFCLGNKCADLILVARRVVILTEQ